MNKSLAIAAKNKQMQQARAVDPTGRKVRDANLAANAMRKQITFAKSGDADTIWKDDDGMVRGAGTDYMLKVAKAVNLSDKSPDVAVNRPIDTADQSLLAGAQAAAAKFLEKKQKDETVSEEAPANAMGTAGISGAETATNVGIAGNDLPIGMVRRKPPKMFAGKVVFTVPSKDFYSATLGRKKGKHYRSYVSGELGEEVRQYALENKHAPIILEDETTGAMMYLKYGKGK